MVRMSQNRESISECVNIVFLYLIQIILLLGTEAERRQRCIHQTLWDWHDTVVKNKIEFNDTLDKETKDMFLYLSWTGKKNCKQAYYHILCTIVVASLFFVSASPLVAWCPGPWAVLGSRDWAGRSGAVAHAQWHPPQISCASSSGTPGPESLTCSDPSHSVPAPCLEQNDAKIDGFIGNIQAASPPEKRLWFPAGLTLRVTEGLVDELGCRAEVLGDVEGGFVISLYAKVLDVSVVISTSQHIIPLSLCCVKDMCNTQILQTRPLQSRFPVFM